MLWSGGFGYAATVVLGAASCMALPAGYEMGLFNAKPVAHAHGSKGCAVRGHNFSVPVDHFHNDTQYEPHSDGFYPLRYFLQKAYYKPGGPVIVIAAGETSAENRIPYLSNGIGSLLAKATGGLVLTLEHRYYGTSFPVAQSEDLASLRFLTTEQALADTAYFAEHVKFPGLEDVDLSPSNTPWIIYGGSYAGAFAAFTRKLYPDSYWGAISSSGVTEAVYDNWEYAEATRLFAPGDCGSIMSKTTHVVDTALFSGDDSKVNTVKELFGYNSSIPDAYFGSYITHPVGALQSDSWVEGEGNNVLETYCATITSEELQYPDLASSRATAKKFVQDAGYDDDKDVTQFLNYVGRLRRESEKQLEQRGCDGALGQNCHQTRDSAFDPYPSWLYQQCTQWGYFLTGSGAPKDTPGIMSRAITLEFASRNCKSIFKITQPPNVESINRLGGTNFSYPRVAVIDGKQDPWRSATPHKIGANTDRQSTTEEPFFLIDPATHHWDEFDVPASKYKPGYPPKQITDIHDKEVEFVKAWIQEFHSST